MPFTNANEAKHAKLRANPSRPKFLLRQAVTDTGVPILGYEARFDDTDWREPVWYDVAVQLGQRIGLIFLRDAHTATKLNIRARERKIAYAKSHAYPFIEVWPTSQMRMRAQIELWLATLGQVPYREADKRIGKLEDAGTMRRPFKDRMYN